MNEALFSFFGQPVTVYALLMALSAAMAAGFAAVHLSRAGFSPRAAEIFVLLAIPLCLLFSRAVFVAARLSFFLERGDGMAFRLWQGGYTIWGAILGFLLAGYLNARITGHRAPKLLDALAPAGMLMVALGRFLEGAAAQGFGEESLPALRFFPFSVKNVFGEWRWAVFMLEGLAALLFMLIVLKDKDLYPGWRIRHALALLCASQILFESFREDEFLRWGFVRAGQVFPAVLLFALLLEALYKGGGWRAPRHQALSLFALLILAVTALEFALDKTTLSTALIYTLMLLAVSGLYALVRRVGHPAKRRLS